MSKTKLSHELEQNAATDWKDEILKSIAYSGSSESAAKPIIGNKTNSNSILDTSNGSPRISRTVTRQAALILNRPSELSAFGEAEIRCCLCSRIIGYPAWYYKLSFAVNQFHYFICFASETPDKPTARCYRKG